MGERCSGQRSPILFVHEISRAILNVSLAPGFSEVTLVNQNLSQPF